MNLKIWDEYQQLCLDDPDFRMRMLQEDVDRRRSHDLLEIDGNWITLDFSSPSPPVSVLDHRIERDLRPRRGQVARRPNQMTKGERRQQAKMLRR